MSWGSGIFMLIVGVLSGAFRVYSRKPFSEDKLLHIMHKYRPGFMLLSCFQVSLLNAFLQDKPHLAKAFSEVEMLYAVGSKISPKQFETTQKHLGSGKLLVWYGMTECVNGTNTILCSEYRPHTVGKVCINTELKILSLETGQTLGPNKQGEIYLRGPTMLGYFDNPEATAQVLDAKTGWFKTGDIGYYDEDGYVYVMDRIKEIAKYKGIYVNPSDIEDVVCQHPDVRGCAVVSVPHDEVCDLMVGYVELLPGHENNVTAQELEQYTNERVQDYEKLRGGLYIVKTLPVLTNGKKDKTTVRKIAKDMTNQIYDKYNSIVSSKG
uniref:Putative acyl-coa synthetase n=1 Tax=Xenopsylla cheopis TaxID=163159 RepID=A0A6M2E2L5_XENCH